MLVPTALNPCLTLQSSHSRIKATCVTTTLTVCLPATKRMLWKFTLQAVQPAVPPSWVILKTILQCGENVPQEHYLPPGQQKRTVYTFHTDTAFSREAWAFTTELKRSVLPLYLCQRETPQNKFKLCRISAPRFYAALRPTLYTLQKQYKAKV